MTSSPHDALFKAVFSDPANAAGELQSVLPESVSTTLDWPTLALEPGSFVDEALSDRHTDLLYSVQRRSGGQALVYVLFEHQSSPDAWMGFRLLVYIVRIWEAHRKAYGDGEKLPPIVPVVLYQGHDRWLLRRLIDCVALSPGERSAYAGFVPDFEFVVDDLRGVSDDQLRQRAVSIHAKITLALMRDAQSKLELSGVLRRWKAELAELLAQPTGASALGLLLRYVTEVRDGEVEALRDVIGQLGPAAEDVMMTMAERWKQEGEAKGRAEGKAEGRAQGRAESIFAVLAARGIDVSTDERAHVLACQDMATLDRWLARAVTAAATSEIFV